jgi:hypothetical protein
MIRVVYPDPDFLPIPDPGSRGQKGTGFQCLFPSQSIESGLIKGPDNGPNSIRIQIFTFMR